MHDVSRRSTTPVTLIAALSSLDVTSFTRRLSSSELFSFIYNSRRCVAGASVEEHLRCSRPAGLESRDSTTSNAIPLRLGPNYAFATDPTQPEHHPLAPVRSACSYCQDVSLAVDGSNCGQNRFVWTPSGPDVSLAGVVWADPTTLPLRRRSCVSRLRLRRRPTTPCTQRWWTTAGGIIVYPIIHKLEVADTEVAAAAIFTDRIHTLRRTPLRCCLCT
jgi:hypothetical protein